MVKKGLVIILLFAGLHAGAQSVLDGAWVLKDAKAISGTLYADGWPREVTIELGRQVAFFDMVTGTDIGDIRHSDTLPLDGRYLEWTTVSKGMARSAGHWDGSAKTLIEESRFYDRGDSTEPTSIFTDTWRVVAGELLLDKKAVDVPSGRLLWEWAITYTLKPR